MVRNWVDNSYEVVSELFFIMQMHCMFITSAAAGNKLYPGFSIKIWWFLKRWTFSINALGKSWIVFEISLNLI